MVDVFGNPLDNPCDVPFAIEELTSFRLSEVISNIV